MASERPSHLPDSFQLSRTKGNPNDELIDFFRRASLRSSVVLDHDFGTRLSKQNTTTYVNYDINIDLENSDDEKACNSDLETIKKRIHKENVKRKLLPCYYSSIISRKKSQLKQESLKANVPRHTWLDIENKVLTSSATRDVTRRRANTFPSESTRPCSIPIETTITRYATDEISDNQSISSGNTSVKTTDRYLMLPSVWKGKTTLMSSAKTSMLHPAGGADQKRDVLNTQGAAELYYHNGGTRQNNQDELSKRTSSMSSFHSVQFSFQGKVFTEDPHPEVNLPDKISQRNIKKNISKVPFLKKKVSPKGKGSFLNHSQPKARSMDLHMVSCNSQCESKQASTTLNRGPLHKSTHKKDLSRISQTVKEFIGKPQPRASWPSLRVLKGTSLDLQFPCGKQDAPKAHLSKTAQSSAVPVNTDTCPPMSKFRDRKWYYQDKTGRCRYLRGPVSPTPSVSQVFVKEETPGSRSITFRF